MFWTRDALSQYWSGLSTLKASTSRVVRYDIILYEVMESHLFFGTVRHEHFVDHISSSAEEHRNSFLRSLSKYLHILCIFTETKLHFLDE